jgi:hypothetical protein
MQGSIVLLNRHGYVSESHRYQELTDAFERLGYHFNKSVKQPVKKSLINKKTEVKLSH